MLQWKKKPQTKQQQQPNHSYFLEKHCFWSFFCSKFPSVTGLTYLGKGYDICALVCPCRQGATDHHRQSKAFLCTWIPILRHMPSIPGLFKRTSIHYRCTTATIYTKDMGALSRVHSISICRGIIRRSLPLCLSAPLWSSVSKHSHTNVLKEWNFKNAQINHPDSKLINANKCKFNALP